MCLVIDTPPTPTCISNFRDESKWQKQDKLATVPKIVVETNSNFEEYVLQPPYVSRAYYLSMSDFCR